MSPKLKMVALATSVERSKTNFRLTVNNHSYIKLKYLAKIGLVDVEIIVLTEIVKNK